MRTKKEIVKDFAVYLRSQGINASLDKAEYDEEYQAELMAVLMEKLYETEDYNGSRISTTLSFYLFCELVLKYDNSTKHSIWNSFVKEQFEMIERNMDSCYLAPRGSGKTVEENTLVCTDKGLIPIKDIVVGDKIISIDEKNLKQKNRFVSAKTEMYKKVLFELITRSGRRILLSDEHPVMTVNGWKTIDEGLVNGDYVSIPKKISFNGSFNNVNAGVIAGLLVSEGYCGKNAVKFTNQDLGLFDDLMKACTEENISFGKLSLKHNSDKDYGLSLNCTGVYYLFPKLKRRTSYTHEVPLKIQNGDEETVKSFLKYYFEGDGGVEENSISCCSMSRLLLEQVQHLLLMFGIYCLIKKKIVNFRGKEFLSYRLFINGGEIIKFYESIGFVSDRKLDKLKSLVGKLRKVKRNSNVDVIPIPDFASHLYIQDSKCVTEYSLSKFLDSKKYKLNKYLSGKYLRVNDVMRTHFDSLFNSKVLDKLQFLLDSDVRWDEIMSIESVGLKNCYDLQIGGRGTNNYLANGLFVHNSFVAFCLYPVFKNFLVEGFQALLCSNIPRQVKDNVRVLQGMIENNELLLEKKDVSNMKELIWSKTETQYNKGFIQAISMGTSPKGAHVSYICFDDPLRSDNRYRMEYIVDYVLSQLKPCTLRKKGRTVVCGCVVPNTWINTFEGLERIGDLIEYDPDKKGLIPFKKQVFGKDGWDETSNFYVNGKVKTKKIILENGYDLECSLIHPVWSCPSGKWINKKDISWIQSQNLKVGDWVAIRSGLNIFGNLELKSDPYLMGLYISEGSVGMKGGYYKLTISNGNKEIVDYLHKNNFISCDAIHHRLNSKKLLLDFISDGVVFCTARYKTIPSSIFKTSKENQIKFLRGIFDGDGSSIINKYKNRNKTIKVCLSSASKQLIKQVQQILLNFGIICSIQKYFSKGHYKKDGSYIISSIGYNLICSGINAKEYLDKIGFNIGYKQKKIDFPLLGKKEHFGFTWKIIKKIEDSKNHTVDFVIPKSNSFISNGIVSHNTPLFEEDLFHILMDDGKGNLIVDGRMSKKGFFSKVFRSIVNESKKEVLVPDIFTYEQLMEQKSKLGDVRFNTEYMCKCSGFKNALISQSLWVKCCNSDYTLLQKGEFVDKDKKVPKEYVIFLDPASSDALTADFSAAIVMEWDKVHNKKIVRYIYHKKGRAIDLQINDMYNLVMDFNNAVIAVEKNNIGIAIIQGLVKKGINVVEHVTQETLNKGSKARDVWDWIEDMKNERIIIPYSYDDLFTINAVDKLKSEVLNFGIKNVRGRESFEALAGHDDLVDAFWGCAKYCGNAGSTLPFAICQD